MNNAAQSLGYTLMNLRSELSERGYTLIELLVALSIIGILFGMGYSNFRDFTRRQALLDTTKKIQADLRAAQQMALSGEVPNEANCKGTNRLNGYNFRVISANHYEVRASCSGGNVTAVAKDVTLPPSITISNPFPNPNPILFKVLGNGTNVGSGGTTIRIRQVNGNSSTVLVTNGGQIQ